METTNEVGFASGHSQPFQFLEESTNCGDAAMPKLADNGNLENRCLLSLAYCQNLRTWMKSLNDSTPLSALSIPGTHNSPACFRALPQIRCQAVSPQVQLENGIRFFDVRVIPEAPENTKLILVHGDFDISFRGHKYFRDLVTTVHAFLDRNPSETVILSLKREGSGTHSGRELSCILRDHYAGDLTKWYTEPRIPILGECRGKIVLMRRFALDRRLKDEWQGRGWGLNAQNWTYNTPYERHGDVSVQDFCEVREIEDIDKKIQYVREHLERAKSSVPEITADRHNSVPCGPL